MMDRCRTSDEEVEKGEEEDGGKSEDASGSSRTTSEGSSGGNAQEVLLAISKAYTSGRLGTAPPASHRCLTVDCRQNFILQ